MANESALLLQRWGATVRGVGRKFFESRRATRTVSYAFDQSVLKLWTEALSERKNIETHPCVREIFTHEV